MARQARIRIDGVAGHITLDRPEALNALTHEICRDTLAALDAWEADRKVRLVILDGAGERAFCAGGDIATLHAAGLRGDFGAGRDFWRDEYRMNARLAAYPKPVISFMHGFVMGGGVGFGCHVAHRVVCESTRMAMPECGIGLIPDVGGTFLLARAPGKLGLHLGLTGARMGPGDAIHAGFADRFIPQAAWPALISQLCTTGDLETVVQATTPAPASPLAQRAEAIDHAYESEERGARHVAQAMARLSAQDDDWARQAAAALEHNSPLSMAGTAAMLLAPRSGRDIRDALRQEYRWTWRSMAQGDFLEGIRARIIDKDQNPRWRHATIAAVTEADIAAMLAPLGANELTFHDEEKRR